MPLTRVAVAGLAFMTLVAGTVNAQELPQGVVRSFPSPGVFPQGLAFDGDTLFVADEGLQTADGDDVLCRAIVRVDPASGLVRGYFCAPETPDLGYPWNTGGQPSDLALDGQGSLWVANWNGYSDLALKPGLLLGVAADQQDPAPNINPRIFTLPFRTGSVAVDREGGLLYVGDLDSSTIWVLNADGQKTGEYRPIDPMGYVRPTGLAFVPETRTVWITDWFAPVIREFTTGGRLIRSCSWTPSRLGGVLHAVTAGPEGHLFVVENFWYAGRGQVHELDPGQLECTTGPVDLPPTIDAVTSSPSVLWPPNNTLVSVSVAVAAADDSGETPACRIADVAADEPLSPGDAVIADDVTVWLRATRSGRGDGRTYTLSVVCADAAGQEATSQTVVVVPHDRGRGR